MLRPYLLMAKPKNGNYKISFISVPSQIINTLSSSSLQSFLLSSKNSSKNAIKFFIIFSKSPVFLLVFSFLFALFGMFTLGFQLDPLPSLWNLYLIDQTQNEPSIGDSNLPLNVSSKVEYSGINIEDTEFWMQPDGLGYRPCLDFTEEYRRSSKIILKDRKKYLMVVVSGGMNQQRNQIVDAVVIARIFGSALVVPSFEMNVIWGDDSEFSDIFDFEHFKSVLSNDVRIVSSIPSTHIRTRPLKGARTPINFTPRLIRALHLKRFNREGVLLLSGFDSRLSKDLPSDLQRLKCKVAFHALRFAPPILELGNKLVERMRSKGPYLALHLRMEKDVWVRTGCLPGLSHKYDEIVRNERKLRPKLLTDLSKMTYHDRKLFGHCPLNAIEVSRLLKALGVQRNAMIYWAGGSPLGGKEALLPLIREFPHFYNKESLALPGELEQFANKASLLAALDFIVSENSDVFMPSHGGKYGQGNSSMIPLILRGVGLMQGTRNI